MPREISIFTDYHKAENSLSNFCGLMMKLLYQESPRKFEEFLKTILKTDVDIIIGPYFEQQTKHIDSIPDLSIIQKSFCIFFETKTSDWFYDAQIKKYYGSYDKISGWKILVLLSNFEEDFRKFDNDIQEAKQNNVLLQPLTFEDFVGALDNICDSGYLIELLSEFRSYLDKGGYLPRWKYLLDVVNCAQSMNEIDDWAYITADVGGPYRHRRAKYFGPCSQRKVSSIFEIKSLVRVELNADTAHVVWKNIDIEEDELEREAISKIWKSPDRIMEVISVPMQVFLLHNRFETNFEKSTSGGMQQSKIYFHDIAIDCSSSKELADKLAGKKWSDFRS